MKILDIVNAVCDVVKLDHFDSVYGANDENAQTMVTLATEAGSEIARRVDWRDLVKTFVAATSPATFPADFERVIQGGSVMTAAGEFMRPVTNRGQWSFIKVHPSAQPYYFLSEAGIEFSPAVSAAGASLLYLSDKWVKLANGTTSNVIQGDDNETVFPSELMMKNLIWRWRRHKGLDYSDQLAEFEADLAQFETSDKAA
ncbi:hypothetical protein [Agrobacterium rubi]|uniref:Uncharacterized protein n=1 Tax=Agrobacterium rubi TaxID=28099 RepID=A0ABX2J1P6_9HYPH|nr:hypothetical protein [Agrobacterium rubi]NTF35563.1 hypothetical protein [Agrobacterium rubi]